MIARRRFISSCAAFVFGCALTLKALPKDLIEATKKVSSEYIPNPAYQNAEYEVSWICDDRAFDQIKVGPPPRFTFKHGEFTKVNPNEL